MSDARLQFICPRCHATLRVPAKYLGMRGSCKHCGGRIALVGRPDPDRPQFASLLADPPAAPKGPPATARQQAFLAQLGADPAEAARMDLGEASEAIAARVAARRAADPPTARQLEYLGKLGADPALVASLRSKAEASDLIEAMHLQPTPGQIELLQGLGATGGQIAALRSKGEAEALIQRLRRGA